MLVLCDACSVIMLGKINQLILIKKLLINVKATRKLIEELIHKHKFRISIEVFESVIKLIDAYKESGKIEVTK